jgi:hypothetical protein
MKAFMVLSLIDRAILVVLMVSSIFDISFLITIFLSIVEEFTIFFQFEANAGISVGRIDGKSQFLFCIVKCVGIDENLDDVLMLFNRIPCIMKVKYVLKS